MILNYEELFKPYTKDGHTLENTLRSLKKIANQQGIRPEIVNLALEITFMELAQGKIYPKDKCPCGCGIDKAATALIHVIQNRIFQIDKSYQTRFKDWLNNEHNAEIVRHIETQNEQYLAETMPKESPPGGLRRFWQFMTKPRLVVSYWRYR